MAIFYASSDKINFSPFNHQEVEALMDKALKINANFGAQAVSTEEALALFAHSYFASMVNRTRLIYPTKVEADQVVEARLTQLLENHPRFLSGLTLAAKSNEMPITLAKCEEVSKKLAERKTSVLSPQMDPKRDEKSVERSLARKFKEAGGSSQLQVALASKVVRSFPEKGPCANTDCQNTAEGTDRCARCKIVFYCNQECQKADWKRHKIVCKKAE